MVDMASCFPVLGLPEPLPHLPCVGFCADGACTEQGSAFMAKDWVRRRLEHQIQNTKTTELLTRYALSHVHFRDG